MPKSRKDPNMKIVLLFTVISLVLIFPINLSVRASKSSNPTPIQDEDIEKFIGKEVETGVLKRIHELIEERYPVYTLSFTFQITESEKSQEIDQTGQTLVLEKMKKYIITEVQLSSQDSTLEMDSLLAHSYDGTLNPGVGQADGNYYLTGIAEFSSDTSWTPSNYPMHIGLLNLDTEYFGYHIKSSSPAYDIIDSWDYPYHYAHAVRNPKSNSGSVSFYCSYDYNYI